MKTQTPPTHTTATPRETNHRTGVQSRFNNEVNATVQQAVPLYQIDELSPKSHEFTAFRAGGASLALLASLATVGGLRQRLARIGLLRRIVFQIPRTGRIHVNVRIKKCRRRLEVCHDTDGHPPVIVSVVKIIRLAY